MDAQINREVKADKSTNLFYAIFLSLECEGLYYTEREKRIAYDYFTNKITKKKMEEELNNAR